MQLTPKDIPIGKIMLDPENPRFDSNKSLKSQEQLISILVDESDPGKQLFRSMEKDVKWVNRIVIKSTSFLSKEFREKYSGTEKFDYIVVEGNTRLACLKHTEMIKYTDISKIPVLVAEKENNESIENYNKELHLVQGIANVTVVQEWSAISKARHIYNMYIDNIKKNKNGNITSISNNIATELGIPADDVKHDIRRFAMYLEVAIWAKAVSPNDWPYFEVFDLNDEIREAFGMQCKGLIDFEWNKQGTASIDEEDIDEDVLYKKELLVKIPEIIDSAINENLTSKELRKPFRTFIVENRGKTPEELKNELVDSIFKSSKPRPWQGIIEGSKKASKDAEIIWKKDINYFAQTIEAYPVVSKWSKKYTKQLIEIRDTINKLLEIIKE